MRNKLSTIEDYPSNEVDLAERVNFIVQVWILIEGFTKEVVWKYLSDLALVEGKSLDEKRIAVKCSEKVISADWKRIKQYCNDNGLDLSTVINQDLWKTIEMICKLRNGMVHSNDLQLMFNDKWSYERPEEIKYFQEALDHFSREKLKIMDKAVMKSGDSTQIIKEIFKTDLLKHMFDEAIKYCYELLEHIEYDFVKFQLDVAMGKE